MVRLRRRACLALFLCALFVFGTLMALRTLKPSGGFSALAPGLGLDPEPQPPAARRRAGPAPASPRPPPALPPAARSTEEEGPGPGGVSAALHAFYYTWYGSPRFDSRYLHWDHAMMPHWDPKISASYPKGRHRPPDDLGAAFYPALGPYSSRDPAVLEEHLRQLRAAAIGEGWRGGGAGLSPRGPGGSGRLRSSGSREPRVAQGGGASQERGGGAAVWPAGGPPRAGTLGPPARCPPRRPLRLPDSGWGRALGVLGSPAGARVPAGARRAPPGQKRALPRTGLRATAGRGGALQGMAGVVLLARCERRKHRGPLAKMSPSNHC